MMRQLFFLFLILFICAACSEEAHPPAALTAAPAAPDTVAVFLLQDTAVGKTMEFPAELIPYEQADLMARVQGYVEDLKVDLGDRVRKGQVLALVNAPELQTRVAESQSSLQAARAKYLSSADVFQRMNRASQAKTAGIVAPVDLERSRHQLMADSASYEAAVRQSAAYNQVAGYRQLRAPFDGVVTARTVDKGALVGSGQSLLTIQNNRRLRLRIPVPELYTGAGPRNPEAVFRTDAYPEKSFAATLVRKSEHIDPVTRTELWEYACDNKEGALKAGAFAYVKLHFARKENSFLLPPSAVVTNQERRFVIRIRNGEAEWVDVRQGLSTERGIEVFGDLHNGDTLVAKATDERKPGTRAVWKGGK